MLHVKKTVFGLFFDFQPFYAFHLNYACLLSYMLVSFFSVICDVTQRLFMGLIGALSLFQALDVSFL